MRSLRSTALVALLGFLMPAACHSNLSWVPDSNGHLIALSNEPVKLPGLGYLRLGTRQVEVVEALHAHGFECNEEASTSRTQACIRPPGQEEPTGGVVMLTFDQALLTGVQAQLQPPGDPSGKLARRQFEQIERDWTRDYGRPEEVKRPGITATRRSLRNGTALLAVSYDDEPTLIVEHVKLERDSIQIPPPPREGGTR